MQDISIDPNLEAKDILLNEAAVTEYEQSMAFFYHHLVELNVNIYLVEQILRFPLKLIQLEEAPEQNIFLSHFVDNAMYMSVLGITRLVADDRPDVFTITAFQQRLLKLVKPEYEAAYKECLRDNRFSDPQIRNIRDRAKEFRNTRVAHFGRDFFQGAYNSTIKRTQLFFPEVKALSEKLNQCFSNLGFGREYIMLPTCYWNNKSAGHRSDIERILNSLAKDSHILNLPENSPNRWRVVRSTLTESELSQLNHYRKKFGMLEVE